MRVNVGCGQSPTPGWVNFDNSLTLRLAQWPLISGVLARAKVFDAHQRAFAEAARKDGIRYADACRLPLADGSVEVLYSSHMLEHLDVDAARDFLHEAMRVLRPGGTLRVVVPDLRRLAERYLSTGDAETFVTDSLLVAPPGRSLRQRLGQLVAGERHHKWMYDGASLCRLLGKVGFSAPAVVAPGQTRIADPGALDLREREEESVYVEATRP